MSSNHFKQAPHKLLVIPGPIEVSDDVLYANALPPIAHMSGDFAAVFSDCIRMTKEVVFSKEGQPFIIAGSGTLGWDQVASNLVEPGENALVLHNGYFADSFAECLKVYGANVDEIKAEIGRRVPQADIAAALRAKKYKVITVTHVDTSTGVLSDIKAVAKTVREVSPDTLIAVDGVCSVASEEIRMDEWGLDVVLTASQKGLGTPPGLSIVVASPRAIKVSETRAAPPSSYYASWKKWLPVMQAYGSGKPAYFATPPVNLIFSYRQALRELTAGTISLEERFAAHRAASARIKKAAKEMGLNEVPLVEGDGANGMTALYYPTGLVASDIIPRLLQKDIIVAAGLHAERKDTYFRIGHMGITVVETERGDIDRIINAVRETLAEARASKGLS